MNRTVTQEPAPPVACAVFDRVLVGVDGSPESLEAARQAAVLQDGELALLAAWKLPQHRTGPTGAEVPYYFDADLERRRADEALAAARSAVAPVVAQATIARGFAWNELIREAERIEATLVAVGFRGLSRSRGILAGSTPTQLLHGSPCSLLIAHDAGPPFPRTIVVGVDGSPESAVAYAAARDVAARRGAELRTIVARRPGAVDLRLVDRIVPGDEREEIDGEPVRALLTAAAEADLLVVGSRGLRGDAALGSVSERIAHAAPCSTVVVRRPPWSPDR